MSNFFLFNSNKLLILFNFVKNKKIFNKLIYFKKNKRIKLSYKSLTILFSLFKQYELILQSSYGINTISNLIKKKLSGLPLFLII